MMAAVLTINAGSSSIKFALYGEADPDGDPTPLARGLVEGLGNGPRIVARHAAGEEIAVRPLAADTDHGGALRAVLETLSGVVEGAGVAAVGHRIAHGGDAFPGPVRLDGETMARLHAYVPFAPSHQPHNLKAVEAAAAAFPDAVQVGCFDTAFHQGKPFVSDTYGLPRCLYREGVRRYGHHGLSYEYVAGALARLAPAVADGRVVVCHLGNGASMCALSAGRSVESTMGFSALDGLPMGTRCGQLDPGILLWLLKEKGLSVEEVEAILYRESGLFGLSDLSNDMRTLEAASTAEADEAIAYFCAMVRREIGAMATTLGGLDAVVFTGGIGEHSAAVRRRVVEPLGFLGLHLDPDRNAASALRVSQDDAPVPVLVVPTDEEIVIARAARRFL